jgi:hypothetical protein
MAKKTRKRSKAKAMRPKRAKTKFKTKVKSKTKAKSKPVIKKKPARMPRRKADPKGITEKMVSAFHTVVDTIKETDVLRNKMERPGTSETS